MKKRVRSFMRMAGIVAAMIVGVGNVASSQVLYRNDTAPTLYEYCQQFQSLYTEIREERIAPDSARARFAAVMQGLQAQFASADAFRPDSAQRDSLRRSGAYFVFPLRHYGPSAIGGTRGEGYRDRGFDLFDYTVRGSHPAQDIFIRDRDQDNLDDATGQPVDVLAMTSGLVLAIETDWTPGQAYRGGNWIWLYDPVLHGLFYYAHNNVVDVTPGQWVQAGQKIGEVGRSGFNAYKSRSPTHLHLMYLHLLPSGLPIPQNTYPWLLASRTLP